MAWDKPSSASINKNVIINTAVETMPNSPGDKSRAVITKTKNCDSILERLETNKTIEAETALT